MNNNTNNENQENKNNQDNQNNNNEEKEAERAEKTEYQEIDLPNGRILTRRDGENNIICRVNSTDMSDYLNMDYSPGKAYKK